jgi:hypothetical protein
MAKPAYLILTWLKSRNCLSAGASSYTLKDYSVLLLRGNPIKGQSLDQVKGSDD